MEKDGQQIRLQVSHSPEYEEGQQGVLMVKGNGSQPCPLVACSRGQFVFRNNLVVDAAGLLVTLDSKGREGRVLDETNEKKSPDPNDPPASTTTKAAGVNLNTINRHEFVAHLRKLNQQSKGVTASSRSGNFSSADPSVPFEGPQVDDAPPPPDDSMKALAAPAAGSDFDRWEKEQLEANGGNPVLTTRYPE